MFNGLFPVKVRQRLGTSMCDNMMDARPIGPLLPESLFITSVLKDFGKTFSMLCITFPFCTVVSKNLYNLDANYLNQINIF